MEIILLLLATLFIAGLINFFFRLPTKKLYAWFQSFFSNKTAVVSTPASAAPERERRSAQNRGELKMVFATFDKNGDGFITKQELRESLMNIGIFMADKEVKEMIERVDSNGDGLIDIDEFCELFESLASQEGSSGKEEREEEESGREEALKEAFDVFDGDRDGLISVEELGRVLSSLGLKEGKKMEDCKEMIRKVDMDGDGMVNFDEFKRMMRAGGRLVSAF